MKDIGYADFSLNMYERLQEKPRCAQIELTYRCNLSCLHCYLGSSVRNSIQQEMDFESVCRILDQLRDFGILWLSLTGGEPMIREDFGDIYLAAKKRGFIVSILSNGTFVSPKIASAFRVHKPFYLEIAMNGAGALTYEKISGVKGSYEKFSKGIRILQENGIPFKLKTKVMTLNLSEIPSIRAFAEKIQVPYGVSPTLHPRIDGDFTPLKWRIGVREMAEFFDEEDHSSPVAPCVSMEEDSGNSNISVFHCGAVTKSVCVDPMGHLISCPLVRAPKLDLKVQELGKAYATLYSDTRARCFESASACRNCSIKHLCERCPGISMLEEGDWEKPAEYFCEVAHFRNEKRKIALS